MTGVELSDDVLARAIKTASPALAGLASALGKSARSLQRHLADEGTTLRELFERVRMAEAERRLVAEDIEVGELAGALRYTDASAFGRAFKRWTGETPSDFRASRRRA